MNSAVLNLCITVTCVYMLPFNCNIIDHYNDSRIFHEVLKIDDPFEVTSEETITSPALLDVKYDDCPPNYLRDENGVCRKIKNYVNRTTEVSSPDINDVQVPIEIQYQEKINITTETPTTESILTKFRIHHVVDVKDNGCPTNYLRDKLGECRKTEN